MTTARISTANVHRDFFDDYISPIPPTPTANSWVNNKTHTHSTHHLNTDRSKDQLSLLESLHSSTIGQYDIINTPFGQRKLTYADFTASGRALATLETYIDSEILPLYANTHTTSNTTGLQTTLYRHEARDVIRRACRASLTEDTVIFAGSGATGAVNMAINILHLKDVVEYCQINNLPLPVVLVGPYEHHSNILPWRETGAKVVVIAERFHTPMQIPTEELFSLNSESTMDVLANNIPATFSPSTKPQSYSIFDDTTQQTGCISQSHLHAVLQRITTSYSSPYIIASFSASSNVTGGLEDTLSITAIVKSYGAISAWDYAASASTQKIDMNPSNLDYLKKDIVFFSPHKLIGGVSTPGVLILKHYLLSRTFRPSTTTGGGTVFFVSPREHTYLNNYHEREEAGTPDIIGSIRCGLVFKLKEQLGNQPSLRINAMTRAIINILTKHPYIQVLSHDPLFNSQTVSYNDNIGYTGAVSLLIHTPQFSSSTTPTGNTILPSQFVSSLLNDLFGIQTRHGCMCAGPYLHSLLGISQDDSTLLLNNLYLKNEDTRPGATRISFHYSMPFYVIEYIVKALLWVATHGFKFLPCYKCVLSSGEWKHHSRRTKEDSRRWLNSMTFTPYGTHYDSKRVTLDELFPHHLLTTHFEDEQFNKIDASTNNNDAFHSENSTNQQLSSDNDFHSIPLSIQRKNVVESLTLATYLLKADAMVANLSCTFTATIPNLNIDNITSTASNIDTITRGINFGSIKSDKFTWKDCDLLVQLNQIANMYLCSLKATTFTTTNETFNSSLPIISNKIDISNIKSQHLWSLELIQSIALTSHNSIQNTPLIQTTYSATSAPPHANASFSPWFPTPNDVLNYLNPIIIQENQNPNPSSSFPLSSSTSPSSSENFLPSFIFFLIKSTLFSNFTKPTAILLPCCPIHPGTTLINTTAQQRLTNIKTPLSQLLSTSSFTPTNMLDSSSLHQTQSISYIDLTISKVITSITPTPIQPLKPAWFSMPEINQGLDLHILCLNCWHRHSNTSTTSSSQECVACDCVQFRPAASNTTSNGTKMLPISNPAKTNPKLSTPSLPISQQSQFKNIFPNNSTTTSTTTAIITQPPQSNQSKVSLFSGSLDPNIINKKETKKLYTRILKKTVAEAMIDFDMIRPGDRVLVGVSGGKDSLSLIHALLEIQRSVPIPFEIAAATINPMTEDYDPSPLIEYFKNLGITYYFESFPIMAKAMELAKGRDRFSICSFCSRMRRGMLYSLCRKNSYNVLALGQHLDDFAESFIMSAFHNSALGTMKPNYTNNSGDLRIIRPLALTREAKTREFANLHSLPIISENCPACFEAPKERARVKLMLANQESIHPRLYNNLSNAMKPLMMMGMHRSAEDKAKAMVKFLANNKDDADDTLGDEMSMDANELIVDKHNNISNATGTKQQRLAKGNQKGNKALVMNNSLSHSADATITTTTATHIVPSIIADVDRVPLLSTVSTNPSSFSPHITTLTSDELSNIIMNDTDNSGDEECAECIGAANGDGLSCPIRKSNGKRLRPNPLK